jgi:hypothetical protein
MRTGLFKIIQMDGKSNITKVWEHQLQKKLKNILEILICTKLSSSIKIEKMMRLLIWLSIRKKLMQEKLGSLQ